VATYAIGDIQGCADTLDVLLDEIEFDEDKDRLWLAGDLVNRGPKSLDVLRWARDLGDRVVAVLGNHDFHLLTTALGLRPSKSDTLAPILGAKDRDELIDWVRKRPLLHRKKGHVLVHAGLHPSWSVDTAVALAAEVEQILRSDDWADELEALYHTKIPRWRKKLEGYRRLRAIQSILVSIRCVDDRGALCNYSGHPDDAPDGCYPWYDDRDDDETILYGHWATQGHVVGDGWVALDSGCVWGGKLTAYRLGDGAVFQVNAVDKR
jgi:bis(5'-nucleosyl)-tetraphosphatase (symmetrical)